MMAIWMTNSVSIFASAATDECLSIAAADPPCRHPSRMGFARHSLAEVPLEQIHCWRRPDLKDESGDAATMDPSAAAGKPFVCAKICID